MGLFKKVDREKYSDYFYIALIWTVMAITLDYFFNVLLFKIGLSYYKLDIFVYYAATFILPLLVSTYKTSKAN
jgi:hypothetical protein